MAKPPQIPHLKATPTEDDITRKVKCIAAIEAILEAVSDLAQ
jgi:hypothetical protein